MAAQPLVRLAALSAATLLLASPALAQQGATPAPLADGQKAAIDANGRLREVSPEEARALIDSLTASLSHSDQGLVAVTLPNGARMVDLQGRFESAMLIKLASDGTVETECVTSVAEAEQFLGSEPVAPQPAASVLEER